MPRVGIGEHWLTWLKSEQIDFYIRIKKDAKVPNSQGNATVQVKQLFQFLKAGESLTLEKAKRMTGVNVYLSCLRLEDGELLIVASNKLCREALAIYAKRWQIETLFSCLKGRGFNLEETRVTDLVRIKRLLTVPIIAFCWSHCTGEWRHENIKPITIKKHKRLAKSYFKYGLDWIRDKLLETVPALSLAMRPFIQVIDKIAVA